MSLNGFNGQRNRPTGPSTGRPVADQALGTAPQHQPQSPQNGRQSSWPESYEQQPPNWPQQGQQPQGYPGYGSAGQGRQPEPYGGSGGGFGGLQGGYAGGYAADPYAPNFQPYNPAAGSAPGLPQAEPRLEPATGGRGAAPIGSGTGLTGVSNGLRGGIYGDAPTQTPAQMPTQAGRHAQQPQASQGRYPGQDYAAFDQGQWPEPHAGSAAAPQAAHQSGGYGVAGRGFDAGSYLQQPTLQSGAAVAEARRGSLQEPHREPTLGDWQQGYAQQPVQGYGYGEGVEPSFGARDSDAHYGNGQDFGRAEFGQRDAGLNGSLNAGMVPHGDPYGREFSAQDYGVQAYGAQEYAGADLRGYAAPEQGHDPFGDLGGDMGGDVAGNMGYGQAQGGFAQAQGGELEQAYADEDEEDYEDYEEEAPSRFGRPLMIAVALAGAIFVGGGIAYGYKAFLGGVRQGDPPVVKSASLPTRTKPADAGGMKFAHVDSKIMGRLGDGSGSPAASAASNLDDSGSRKVATLVVGRDGSIQAPAASPAAANGGDAPVSVPGLMVVDALGQQGGGQPQPPAGKPVAVAPVKPVAVPPAKPVAVAKTQVLNGAKASPANQTGSIEDAPAKPAVKPAVKRVAAVQPSAAPARSTSSASAAVTGGNGYVAVLASVPKSSSSRMDALKRFADLQQQYSSVLAGKTPDVAEARVGSKGAYHRLVVGPPGSRQQASTICSGLKAQGYKDCWVTAY